jgi:hypothetical protein
MRSLTQFYLVYTTFLGTSRGAHSLTHESSQYILFCVLCCQSWQRSFAPVPQKNPSIREKKSDISLASRREVTKSHLAWQKQSFHIVYIVMSE